MINETNIDIFLEGRNGDVWESWLTGDIPADEFLHLLKERNADAKEMAFAETSIAYDSSFSNIGAYTVDAVNDTAENLTKAAGLAIIKLEGVNGSYIDENSPDVTEVTRRNTEKNGLTAREQALTFFSKHFGESLPSEGFVVPAAIGLISVAFAFVGIVTNQPEFVWGAVGCGSLLGGFYIFRSIGDSIWNVGTIRFR